MKNLILTMGVFLCAIIWMACTNQSPTTTEMAPSFDLTGARKVVDSVNQVFGALVEKGDSSGIAALYASDAKLMAPNGPAIQGAGGIISAFAGLLKSGVAKAELHTIGLWGTEAMISEEGTYSLFGKDGKELDKGKYIVLWKTEAGKWKMFRDIFNSDMAPSPAK